jgi:hypothetical protein
MMPRRRRPEERKPKERDYVVSLPSFEGLLDLLLHLIQKHELDIFDIPVSFVTEKYRLHQLDAEPDRRRQRAPRHGRDAGASRARASCPTSRRRTRTAWDEEEATRAQSSSAACSSTKYSKPPI